MISKTFVSFSIGFVVGLSVSYILFLDRINREMDLSGEIDNQNDDNEIDIVSELPKEDPREESDEEQTFKNHEILPQEVFEEGKLGYEYFEADWYRKNDVIVDDDFNVFPFTSEELFGLEVQKLEEGEVFVRNHKRRLDFRVRILDREYYIEDE